MTIRKVGRESEMRGKSFSLKIEGERVGFVVELLN